MTGPDTLIKAEITAFLRANGHAVVEIPRSNKKSPDLFVDEGTPESLLLEIKTKQDDAAEVAQLRARLQQTSGVVGRSKPTGAWNNLSGILENGVRQFQVHDPARKHYRVIWFHCEGIDAEVARTRLHATLYGTQKLVSTEIQNVVTAYYFWNSAFHRFRDDLDGVVISVNGAAQLFLNQFSAKLAPVQGTAFVRRFGPPFLPVEKSDEKDLMVCDPGAPRGDAGAMVEFLRRKHSLAHLQIMNMGFQSGWVAS